MESTEVLRVPIRKLAACCSSNRAGSTDRHIAQTILDHLTEFPLMTLEETAALCTVSVSTLLRFCHNMGFPTFPAMRDAVENDLRDRQRMPTVRADAADRPSEYCSRELRLSLDRFSEAIPQELLDRIADAMASAKRVCIFDNVFSTLRLALQTSLAQYGCIVSCANTPQEKEADLKQADSSCVLLSYAHIGVYRDKEVSLAIRATRQGARVFLLDAGSDPLPELPEGLTRIPLECGLPWKDMMLCDLFSFELQQTFVDRYLRSFRYE